MKENIDEKGCRRLLFDITGTGPMRRLVPAIGLRFSFPVVIFIIALIVRIYFAVGANVIPDFDGAVDNSLALKILNGYPYEFHGQYTFRPPFYPMFLSLIYKIFGANNYFIVFVVQSVIGALICVMIYLIAKMLMSHRAVANIAGVFSAVYPVLIITSTNFSVENLTTFFLVLLTWISIKFREHLHSNVYPMLLGVILACLTLTSGIVSLYAFCVLVTIAYFGYSNGKDWAAYTKTVVILCFFIGLSMMPWIMRNYTIYKTFVPISSQTGYVLYGSYRPPNGIFGRWADDQNFMFATSSLSELEGSKFLIRKTWEFIKDNPAAVVKLEVKKFVLLWSPIDWEILGKYTAHGVYNCMYGFIFPFFIYSMIISFKKIKEMLPLFLPIFYYQIITLIFYGSPRFRCTIEPFLIIFFSYGVYYFYTRYSKKTIPCVIISSWLLLNFIVYLRMEYFRVNIKGLLSSAGLW